MPVPINMGVSLNQSQYDTIDKSLDTIINILNGVKPINLTKDERTGIQSVAEKRLPYLEKAFDSLIPDNTNLVATFSNLDEGNADYAYLRQHLKLKTKMAKALEIASDHELAAGYRAFEFMRDFYHMAKRAVERNVPGADSVVDALAPLFEQTNEPAALPTTTGNGNPTV